MSKPENKNTPEQGLMPVGQELQVLMDLETARHILTGVIAFHEDFITEDADLTHIANIHYKNVRQALFVLAEDILIRHDKAHIFPRAVSKDAPEGDMRLLVATDFPGNEYIQLLLSRNSRYLIRAEVPLQDTSWLNNLSGFFDHRLDAGTIDQISQGFTSERVKHGWRGVRWIAANILNWENPTRILPEDLDNIGSRRLPPSLPQLPSVE